jgi:hypothetical protein
LIARRAAVLEKLGTLWVRRKAEMSGNGLDVRSSQFQKVFDIILAKFNIAMERGGMSDSQIDSVMANLGKALEGWEAEAEAKLKHGN